MLREKKRNQNLPFFMMKTHKKRYFSQIIKQECKPDYTVMRLNSF